MSYEAGSQECRRIVDAKDNLIKVMQSLDNLQSAEMIKNKLKLIYDELEDMHEKRKEIEHKSS
ncbi:Hypothetical protein P9211_08301 [Prochlorococcus marinus str. MIT 9211]|uniref:Protein family PM-1 n=1 Tax=Prochlorococcus marinus (strain MIT 9211) TaxID=93059 RepID=A9BA99_PROM4|nr:Hypothetical protein P9211_08301 [Prochlorococcus marinus str. MIT 9211]